MELSKVTEGSLLLKWLNRKSKAEYSIINIPVKCGERLESFLEPIFWKTAELAGAFNNTKFSAEFINLLQNGSPLTKEEYDLPVDYFANFKNNEYSEPLQLITYHCGVLTLQVQQGLDISPSKDAKLQNADPIPIKLDLSLDTVGDLKRKIENTTNLKPDFVFTESNILDYPGKLYFGDIHLGDLRHFEEIRFTQKTTQDDLIIELIVERFLEGNCCVNVLKQVLILSSSMTSAELESLIRKMLLEQFQELSNEIDSGNLFLIPGANLKSSGVHNGSQIFFHLYNLSNVNTATEKSILKRSNLDLDADNLSTVEPPSNSILATRNSQLGSIRSRINNSVKYLNNHVGKVHKNILESKKIAWLPPMPRRKSLQPKHHLAGTSEVTAETNEMNSATALPAEAKVLNITEVPMETKVLQTVLPLGSIRWILPGKGLNFIGACQTSDCGLQIAQKGTSPLTHWKKATFDLLTDRNSVICPMCKTGRAICSVVFHMTQWKYYGQRRTVTSASKSVGSGGSEDNGSGVEQSTGLVSSDWFIADGEYDGMGLILANSEINIEDWDKLTLMTKPLEKSKRQPQVNDLKVGFNVSLTSFSFNMERSRNYRK